jgi:hypothetical protein
MKQSAITLKKTSPAMKAMVIYDSFSVAAKANCLLQSAAVHSACVMNWEIKPWRADLLKMVNFIREASLEASDAHLIIIAAEKIGSLPYWLEHWLEDWAVERKIEEAALGIVDYDPRGHLPLFPQAYRFAARHGLNFIYQPQERKDYPRIASATGSVQRVFSFSQPCSTGDSFN